jgi:carbon storage regulator CsrA
MLVLTRRIGEKIVIDDVISVTVVAIRGDKARLGINAPPSVRVDRSEVHERRQASRPAVPQPSISSCLEGATPMRTVQQGDRVQVQYVKRLRDGRTASSREPFEVTAGIDHPRLPGLGMALIGLTAGQAATLTLPPEQAYGLPDPARIHRWSRRRFPEEATLRAGKLIRFTDDRGRRHRVRILEANSKMVVVDVNHPWAGQTLDLEVKLLGFLEPRLGPEEATAVPDMQQPRRCRAVAFDVDATSLASLRDALVGWEIVVVNGAIPASLSSHWDPAAADLLVVGTRDNATETLGLCRLLSFCTSYSTEARREGTETLASEQNPPRTAVVGNAPLLVLVPPGQETLVGAALEAGAYGCLMLPIHAKEVTSMLAHARAGNRPGRHTLGLDRPQEDDPWQEDGGEA